MNGLSKLVPALDVALFILSVTALVFPACSPSSFPSGLPPRPHPIVCRLLVIFVATCFGVSGFLQLVSHDNSGKFAARVTELVGQSVATFTTIWFFFKFCLLPNQRNGAPVSSSSTAAGMTPSCFPTLDNGSLLRSKMRSWAFLFTPISRILHVTLIALFMAAILLSFICVLPLAVYPLDNGAVSKALVPAYTGPLLESLVAFLLFIRILLLNVNYARASPIFRRQYGHRRARLRVCSLSGRRGPAVFLFVQFLSLAAYTFAVGATASQHGTQRGGPLIGTVVLIGDLLLLFWIAGWVGVFYFLGTRPSLLFPDEMVSPHEPIPIVSVSGRLSPSPLCPRSKTPRATIYSEDPSLAASVILSPPSSSFGGRGPKGREYGKELVTLGLNDDEEDDSYLRTSSHSTELPTVDTIFPPSPSFPSSPPPGLVIDPPSFFPLLAEHDAKSTPVNDTHIGTAGPRDIPSLRSSSPSSLPIRSPVPSTRWKELSTGRLRKAPPPAIGPAYAPNIGKRAPSGYPGPSHLCRKPPSGRQSRMGFRIRDLPSVAGGTADVSGGSSCNNEFGLTRPRENRVMVQASEERGSVRGLAANVPMRASDALNMLEGSPHQRSAAPLQSPPRRPMPPQPSLFRQQHPFPPPPSLSQRQNESENDPASYISTELALNSILEHHKYSGHNQEGRLAYAHLLNLDAVAAPVPAVLGGAGQSSLHQLQPAAHGHKQRGIIPLSPSEEFLADLHGDPFASVPSTPRPTTSGTVRSTGGKESFYTPSYTSLSTPSSPAFPPSLASLALPFPPLLPASRFRRVSNSDVSLLVGDNDSVARLRSATASSSVSPPMRTDETERPFIGLGVTLGLGSTLNLSSQLSSRSSPCFPPAGLPLGVQSPSRPKQGSRRPSTASGALERVHHVSATLSTSPRPHPSTSTASQDSGRNITQTIESKRKPRPPPDTSLVAADQSNGPLPGPMPSPGDRSQLSKAPGDTPAPAPLQAGDPDQVAPDIGVGATASIREPMGNVDVVPRQHPKGGSEDSTASESETAIEGEGFVASPPRRVDSVPVGGGGVSSRGGIAM